MNYELTKYNRREVDYGAGCGLFFTEIFGVDDLYNEEDVDEEAINQKLEQDDTRYLEVIIKFNDVYLRIIIEIEGLTLRNIDGKELQYYINIAIGKYYLKHGIDVNKPTIPDKCRTPRCPTIYNHIKYMRKITNAQVSQIFTADSAFFKSVTYDDDNRFHDKREYTLSGKEVKDIETVYLIDQ